MITLFSCWEQSQMKKSFMTIWQCYSTTEGIEDHRGPAVIGADDVGNIAGFHGKSLIFKFFGQRAAIEVSEIAALSGAGAVRIFLGNVPKLGAFANLCEQVVGFGLRCGNPLLFSGGIVGVVFLCRNKNFA